MGCGQQLTRHRVNPPLVATFLFTHAREYSVVKSNPKSALTRLTSWETLPSEDALTSAFEEIEVASDRAAGILAACFLEDALQTVIINNFKVRLDRDERNNLFGGIKPLGSFSSKIDIGYAMGLYGRQAREDLHSIRTVRNAFAHAARLISFETKEVADVCATLKRRSREQGEDVRSLYIETVLLLTKDIMSSAPPRRQSESQ